VVVSGHDLALGVVFASHRSSGDGHRGRLHTFCHTSSDRWHVMASRRQRDSLYAGFEINLVVDVTATRPDSRSRASAGGAGGVLWAPYLMGERTPTSTRYVRGALVGLDSVITVGTLFVRHGRRGVSCGKR
jgi:xylulokinase